MKTKLNFGCIAAFVMLLLGFKSLAQPTITFQNNFGCDVTVCYEMRDNPGPGGCGVCATGCLTLSPGDVVLINQCPGYADICIWISDIGGCTPPSNHISDNVCHVLTPYGQSGTVSSGCNCAGTPWNATFITVPATAQTWIIQ